MNDNYHVLKQKVLSGMIILIIRDFSVKIISIVGQVILIKLVMPQYFGIFAIISFVVYIFELLTDLGLGQAIIREKKSLTSIQFSTLFYTKIILASFSFLLLILLFPLVRFFYHQLTPDSFLMLIIFGTTIFLKAIKSLLFATYDRELRFNIVSRVEVIGIFFYFLIAIFMAIQKIYIWNFIIATVVKESMELCICMYLKQRKLTRMFNIKSILPMLKYGSFLQIGNYISFVEHSIIPIAGFQLSSNNIGLLYWGENVASLSNTIFDNYGRAAFAGFSRIQTKHVIISQAVNKSISLLNLFAFLFVILVLGFSREATMLLFSKNWLAALPALYWFVGGLIFFGTSITIAHALLALGKSREISVFTGAIVLIEILLAFIMVERMGFMGIPIAAFIYQILSFCGYVVLGKKSSISIQLRKPFGEKLLIFILCGFFVLYLNNQLFNFSMVTMTVKIIGTVVFYFLLTIIISKEDVIEVVKMIHPKVLKKL